MMKSRTCINLLNINKYYRTGFMRHLSDDRNKNDGLNPIQRTLGILANDMRSIKNYFAPFLKKKATPKKLIDSRFRGVNPSTERNEFQTHCDVLVIGEGAIAASIAYWLKKKARNGLSVVVLERDMPHLDSKVCSTLPVGGLHQQFYLPENIEMSLFGAQFVMNAKEDLGIDLNYDPQGFLTLASDKNAQTLKEMALIQTELGARIELLTPERLRAKFPWLNTDDVALGCQGLEKHGWFDANNFLLGLRFKAKEYEAYFCNAELIDFEFQNLSDVIVEGETKVSSYNALDKAVVKMPDGDLRTIKFAICVIATENNTENTARLAKIGSGSGGLLRIPLPIQRREFYGYSFNADLDRAPSLNTPCIVDFNGTHFRRDGLTGNYIAGFSTTATSDSESKLKENDFKNIILPSLMHRLKMSKPPKIMDSWKSSFDYNVYDENGIIGAHAYYNNLYIATAFSCLGLQQSPAVGRAISELIIDGQFRKIDLTRLSFDRIIVDQPTVEYAFM
ncbi:FAD-dependent oxidoreductase domain-containing protein 1 isoform X1 [Eurosta solidaginis]|uniref:FAD-dependent oxidoreductase domain-containing protein 1 isoform X1 n=1 Tax=Eurosta solidaginis TaxID=178769 RepID=UPI0035314E5A